jgi:hypothetical protein
VLSVDTTQVFIELLTITFGIEHVVSGVQEGGHCVRDEGYAAGGEAASRGAGCRARCGSAVR